MALDSYRDHRDREVATFEGRVSVTTGTGKRGDERSSLWIGNQQFPSSTDYAAANATIDGALCYRLYYAPHTKRLLSLEVIGDGRDCR